MGMRRSPGFARTTIVVALVFSGRLVAADEVQLSIADAVKTALASDADLYIGREDSRTAADSILLARSAFAPKLFGQIYGTRDDQAPSATSFGGLDTVVGSEVGISGRIGTGLTYTLAAGLARETRADPFSTVYSPATTTTVRVELVQPLWRGSFAAARRPIVVASLRRGLTDHELRARIERTVGAVHVAYWNLVRARSEHEARESALSLANEQVNESRRITKLGTGSELDVVEAEAGVSRRQQELLRSEQGVADAEGRLLDAMGVRAGDAGFVAGRAIVPTESTKIEPFTAKLEAQLALARTRRGDALAAKDLIAAELAQLEVTDDKRRVAVDLVGAADSVGFAGTFVSNYATAGVNGGGLSPPFTTDPAYNGGVGQSVGNTLGRDLRLYVGLRLEMWLGDHEAEVRHSLQQRSVARARLAERATLAQIENDVRTIVARASLDSQLVDASDKAVTLSEKLLEGTRKRFRAGAATSFDVLRVSDDLTRARVEAARARADYRVSTTRLAVATGTLLEGLGITTKSLGATPH
jgi:outer membrane protein TolC